MTVTRIYDLSHPILNRAPCTFGTADKVPIVTFEEGDSHGTFFVTSRLDNFYSNAGTQIDFPGHLTQELAPSSGRLRRYDTVGEYPLERFIGPCAIIDFSWKMRCLDEWFDTRGVFRRSQISQFADFIHELPKLEISLDEFKSGLRASSSCRLEELTGVLFYSGNTEYWSHEIFESWEYRYFYAPYLAKEVADLLVQAEISLVGIDAFQIENPIANVRGDELPLVINREARNLARDQLMAWKDVTNHELLLGRGVLIYESLRIPAEIAGCSGEFSGPPINLQLPGLDDDAVARPYIAVMSD